MGKPKSFQGELWKQGMERREHTDPGYITVLMKFPAEVADDAYLYFNFLNVRPTPFVLVLPDNEENKT